MSATNTTTHYNLPSFLPTDKPAWLVDWNGAMASIDAGIYQAQQTADNSTTDISALQNSLTTLSGTVDSQGLTISTLSQSLTTAIGNINTINSLIGNGTPTTTDQTIIGAINEINARTGEAEGISYDNSDSGLSATNVQGAIDENANAISDLNSDLDGYKFHTLEVTKTSTGQYFHLTEVPKNSFNIIVNINDENTENIWCCPPYTYQGGIADEWICAKFNSDGTVNTSELTLKLRISYWSKT